MDNDSNDKKAYRDDIAEASLELNEVFDKIEQLTTCKTRGENVVETLGRRIGITEPILSLIHI